MDTQRVSPDKTLAVLLGASDFPKAALTPSPQFKRSAEAFQKYLLDPTGFNLPRENLLNLFDSPHPSSRIDEEVSDFLQAPVRKDTPAEQRIENVFVYHVGHGGFSPESEYYLSIRETRDGNRLSSSYAVKSLARTIKDNAAFARRFIIFDSCFAASAYKEFQSGPLQVAVLAVNDALPPSKGTALLCASGPKNPAKAPPDLTYTMFSGASLDVLTKGDPQHLDYLSFDNVAELVHQRIRDLHDDEAVRPEIHFPDQTEGAIGKVAIFPNIFHSKSPLESRLDALEPAVRLLADDQKQNAAAHDAMLQRIGAMDQRIAEHAEQMKRLANAASNAVPPAEMAREFDDDVAFMVGRFPVTEGEWRKMPAYYKNLILQAQAGRRNGNLWVGLCVMAATLPIVMAPFFRALYLPAPMMTFYGPLLLNAIFATVGIAALLIALRKARGKAVARDDESDQPAWRDHGAVAWARMANITEFLHGTPILHPG